MNEINLEEMTLQEAADYSVFQIVEQGRPCVIDDDCLYSANIDGVDCRCPIGYLLPDDSKAITDPDKYYTASVRKLCNEHCNEDIKLPQLIQDNIDFFRALQKFHDNCGRTHYQCSNNGYPPEDQRNTLNYEFGINTDKPQWQQWIGIHNELVEQQ